MAQVPLHCVPQIFAIPMYSKRVPAHMDGNIKITDTVYIYLSD